MVTVHVTSNVAESMIVQEEGTTSSNKEVKINATDSAMGCKRLVDNPVMPGALFAGDFKMQSRTSSSGYNARENPLVRRHS